MPLSEAKIALVAKIFAAAPSAAVDRLESLLGVAQVADPTLEPVYNIAAEEAGARRTLAAIFSPLIPLICPATPPKRARLTMRQLRQAWNALSEGDSGLAESAGAVSRMLRPGDDPPHEFDLACRRAAELVGDAELARLLRLAPVLRALQPRLPGWVRSVTGETVAAIRLAFKDAIETDEDAGPLFWDAVMAMLDEPWRIIRLISAATDRPSDRYLAASELAPIGERILSDVDERLADLKHFDPAGGAAAGAKAATSVLVAVQVIDEFEQWLAMKKDGPWGMRIAAFKAALAVIMEARLRETEPAVAAALPTLGRGPVKAVRPAPKLTEPPQPLLIARANAFLVLLDKGRTAANPGGFASARGKTVEALEKRLDQYCDDLLDLLHRKEVDDPERVRAYLEVAAEFYHRVKGPEAAQIVRRRAAAA
jgi:hypothetical protein